LSFHVPRFNVPVYTVIDPNQNNYRWYLLSLAVVTNMLLGAIPAMAMSVMSDEISQDLHLTLPQVGIVWGIGALPGILTALMGGALGDRIGPKRVLVVGTLLVGLLGAARGLAFNFASMTAIVFMVGGLSPFTMMNSIKTIGSWFPSRQLGLANGLISMGMALGFLTGSLLSATLLSPLLGGWRYVFILYGSLGALMSIPWLFTRQAPPGYSAPARSQSNSFRQTVSRVAGVRDIWLLGLALFGVGGCVQGLLGYLPLYLRHAGWAPLHADGALTIFHAISMLFVLPIALFSDRLHSRKRLLFLAAASIALGTGMLSIISGALVWICVLMAGFVRDGFMAIYTTMVIETEGVGPAYAGTALGITNGVSGIGNVIAPPLGNSLAVLGSSAPFAFWSGLAVLGIACLSLTRRSVPQAVETALECLPGE
jgi:MFS family permease